MAADGRSRARRRRRRDRACRAARRRPLRAGHRHALDIPDVHLHVADARAWLGAATRKWDVVVSGPSNPWVAGVASLYTREFFEVVRGPRPCGRGRAGSVVPRLRHGRRLARAQPAHHRRLVPLGQRVANGRRRAARGPRIARRVRRPARARPPRRRGADPEALRWPAWSERRPSARSIWPKTRTASRLATAPGPLHVDDRPRSSTRCRGPSSAGAGPGGWTFTTAARPRQVIRHPFARWTAKHPPEYLEKIAVTMVQAPSGRLSTLPSGCNTSTRSSPRRPSRTCWPTSLSDCGDGPESALERVTTALRRLAPDHPMLQRLPGR